MSMRDVSKATRGETSTKMKVRRTKVIEVDVELQVKAIELVRSGEARNPNDLVLRLRIPLESAERLFNKIVENEGITTTLVQLVLEATREPDKLVKEVSREARELRDMLNMLKTEKDRITRTLKEI